MDNCSHYKVTLERDIRKQVQFPIRVDADLHITMINLIWHNSLLLWAASDIRTIRSMASLCPFTVSAHCTYLLAAKSWHVSRIDPSITCSCQWWPHEIDEIIEWWDRSQWHAWHENDFWVPPEVKPFIDMQAYMARLAEHFLGYVAQGKNCQLHLMMGSTQCCLAWHVAVQSWQGFRDRWWWRSPGVVWVDGALVSADLWWWARIARVGQTLNLQMKTKPKAACWPGKSLLRWNLAKVSCVSTHPLPHPLGCS